MTGDAIRIFIVDDHPVFVYGLESVLGVDPAIRLVGKASNAAEAFHQIKDADPEIVLADINMPGLNGIDFLQRIRKAFPQIKVIMLTALEDEQMELRAFKLGAYAYVHKSDSSEDLVNTIVAARRGQKTLTSQQGTDVLDHFEALSKESQRDIWNLDPSDILLLGFLAEGHNYKVIADKLNISEATVKRMVAAILIKMGANNRTHAVSLAIRHAII